MVPRRRPERPVLREPPEARPKILGRAPAGAARAPQVRAPEPALADVAASHPAATLAEARALRVKIGEDFYRLGELLVVLAQPKAFEALGYDSFVSLLGANDFPGRTTSFKLMAVVRSYPRDRALELGRSKAYALIRYQAEGGAPDQVSGASVRTVNEAARLLREKGGRSRRRVPPDALRHAHRLQALARRRGADRSRVRALVVGSEVWQRLLVPDDEADLLMEV